MSYYFPEGSKAYYSNTMAAAKTVTAITNANPAVATATTHGYSTLDPILFTSGWEDATDSVFEVTSLTADTFSVMGLDSSDTNWFPAGTGTGNAKKVSGWTEIPQLLTLTSNGGGPKYGTISPLGKRNDIKRAIGFEATSIDLTMGYDPANATYLAMLGISRVASKVAIKIVVPGGGRIYGYGAMTTSEIPRMTKGQVIEVSAAISFDGRTIGYGA